MKKDKSEELKKHLEEYLARAEKLFDGAEVAVKTREAEHVLTMAMSYYKDALHYYKKGEYMVALGALEYGEGWLDAGRYLKLIR